MLSNDLLVRGIQIKWAFSPPFQFDSLWEKNTHSCSNSISLWHPTPTPAPAALGVFSEDQALLLCRWRNLPALARQGVKGSLALALCKPPLLSLTQPFFSSILQLLTPGLTAWGLPPARSSLRDFLFAVNPWCKNTGHVCTFDGSSLLNLPSTPPSTRYLSSTLVEI